MVIVVDNPLIGGAVNAKAPAHGIHRVSHIGAVVHAEGKLPNPTVLVSGYDRREGQSVSGWSHTPVTLTENVPRSRSLRYGTFV